MKPYRLTTTKYVLYREYFLNFGYSVMQSDGISFCGDIVLDTFNKTSRDADNILYQIFKIKYVRNIITVALKPIS